MSEYELYTLIKNEDDKECYIQFQVIDDEELKWVGDNGEPTEVLQQSGWSFQDDGYKKLFSEFIEEAEQLDLLKLTEGMASGDVLKIHDGLKIKKE